MRFLFVILIWFLTLNVFAQTSYNLMFYNILNYPSSDNTKADTLAKIIDYTNPDLLMLTEITSSSAVDLLLENALNTNGISYWDNAPFLDGPDSDNLLFYNTNLYTFVEVNAINTNLRDINEYVLYLNESVDLDTAYLYVYVAHLKAGNSSENATARTLEAALLKDYIDTRTQGEHFIISGDFNVYSSSENAYQTLLNYGLSFNDPIEESGDWHDNFSYKSIHTQSTRTVNLSDGGSVGGMDDRFDFILISDDLLDGALSYIPNSYESFGQDGEHYNDNLLAGDNMSIPQDINKALYYMSDHLPVLMQLSYDASVSVSETKLNEDNVRSVIDLLGRETQPEYNTFQFYIYEDGRIRKKMILE